MARFVAWVRENRKRESKKGAGKLAIKGEVCGVLFDSLVLLRCDDIVNLEDHFDDLGGQFKLLLLGHHRLKDALFVHIHGSLVIRVHAKERVVFSDLLFSQFGYVLD